MLENFDFRGRYDGFGGPNGLQITLAGELVSAVELPAVQRRRRMPLGITLSLDIDRLRIRSVRSFRG